MKTYLIVGGTSGIGLAISKLLQSRGHRTIVMSRHEHPEIQDNSEFHIWDAMKDPFPILEHESLDGMVYCPGSILLKPFHRISDLEFQEALQLNALGAAKALQAVYPLLRKSGHGSVVLFSTVAVQTGMPFHSSVAMAKGAVEGLTKMKVSVILLNVDLQLTTQRSNATTHMYEVFNFFSMDTTWLATNLGFGLYVHGLCG